MSTQLTRSYPFGSLPIEISFPEDDLEEVQALTEHLKTLTIREPTRKSLQELFHEVQKAWQCDELDGDLGKICSIGDVVSFSEIADLELEGNDRDVSKIIQRILESTVPPLSEKSLAKLRAIGPSIPQLSLMGTETVTKNMLQACLGFVPHLERLDLSYCKTLADDTVAATLILCPKLKELGLKGTKAGDLTAKALSNNCQHLQVLDMRSSSLTNVGLKALEKCENLQVVLLANCQTRSANRLLPPHANEGVIVPGITQEAIYEFALNSKNLQNIDIFGCRVDQLIIDQIKAGRKDLQVCNDRDNIVPENHAWTFPSWRLKLNPAFRSYYGSTNFRNPQFLSGFLTDSLEKGLLEQACRDLAREFRQVSRRIDTLNLVSSCNNKERILDLAQSQMKLLAQTFPRVHTLSFARHEKNVDRFWPLYIHPKAFSELCNFPQLHTLNLERFPYVKVLEESFLPIVSQLKNLQVLHVNETAITDSFLEGLTKCEKLMSLNVAKCTDITQEGFHKFLMASSPTLQYVTTSGCRFPITRDMKALKPNVRFLTIKTLKGKNFEVCNILSKVNFNLQVIAKNEQAYFQQIGPSITELRFREREITKENVQMLTELFPNVTSILFEHLSIEPGSLDRLLRFKHLSDLDLTGSTGFLDDDLSALSQHNSLSTLRLHNCTEVTDKGFTEFVSSSKTLELLEVFGCTQLSQETKDWARKMSSQLVDRPAFQLVDNLPLIRIEDANGNEVLAQRKVEKTESKKN